ncbi:hypothetical protein M409DRAFT_25954 [Zasmidium cellare ATCC 36951]|uniref:CENP-V/GFA domain-containing protein n=1 Tax=Zasmidium cellare ATCC 36951 TaxID=1080233 RepID=A0A6A6CCX3_ZASCE|nr:uncharacterized protein M409DRAFT_25954 [Zasmidium cellare ATCC 36951]KAF2163772.1 hypothetical protein M409DRAFT_25954 [Zasmidium cellare ATCC 36951]
MAEAINHLFGSCACERNQYEVIIPAQSASLAQVFFDNTALSRRTQASPVTAWLRVPLDWYSSATIALFPDESHSSIKRTFNTPAQNPTLPPTRRQFCGYCGSHLTRWNEGLHAYTTTNEAGYLDVTLGSLLNESLEKLEALRILPDTDSEEEEPSTEGLVRGGTIDDEDHIPTNEDTPSGVDAPASHHLTHIRTATREATQPPHNLQNRGIPYFEEMIADSRLGRIKRRMGGHTSEDGRTSVQWEVVEIGGGNGDEAMVDVSASSDEPNKRVKLDR